MAIKGRRLVIISLALQGMIGIFPVFQKQKKSPCQKTGAQKPSTKKISRGQA